MSEKLSHLGLILNLNDRLFLNSLAGISEQDAGRRISEHNNPVCWIAGHTVHARYLMLLFLGKPAENPYNHLFENSRAYDSSLRYPGMEDVKKEWQKVTDLLKAALRSVTDEQLAGESVIKSPIGDHSNGGTLAFLVQHESYDIGQLALLKKYLTREAMSYN